MMKRTTLVLEVGCMDAVRDLARRQGRQMSGVGDTNLPLYAINLDATEHERAHGGAARRT